MFEAAADKLKEAKISANSVKCPVLIRTCLFLEQHDMLSGLTIDPASLARIESELKTLQDWLAKRRIPEALEAHRCNGRIKRYRGDPPSHPGYLIIRDPVWTAMCTGGATQSAKSGYFASVGWPTRWEVNFVEENKFYAVDLAWTDSKTSSGDTNGPSPICVVVLDPKDETRILKKPRRLQQSLRERRMTAQVQVGPKGARNQATIAVARLVYSAFPRCVPCLTNDHLDGDFLNIPLSFYLQNHEGWLTGMISYL